MRLSKQHKCPMCQSELRPKEHRDWRAGEKIGRGYFPEQFGYFICTMCNRTWCTNLEDK